MIDVIDVIVLGWRNAERTMATVASLAAAATGTAAAGLRLILVDNGSGDGAAGRTWAHLQRTWPGARRAEDDDAPTAPAVFVALARNRGYAGGMNAGLATAAKLGRGRYFWLLANDVAVHPDAAARLAGHLDAHPAVGLCAPTQHRLDADGRVAFTIPGGFHYSRVCGWGYPVPFRGPLRRWPQLSDRLINALQGAAVFGSYRFLDVVGPLSEERFCYFEEAEWSHRARRAGFELAWVPEAVVTNHHLKTMSVGPGPREAQDRLRTAHYLMARGGVVFTRRHARGWLPLVLAARLVRTAEDAVRKGPDVAAMSLAGVVDGFTGRHRRLPLLEPAAFPGDPDIDPDAELDLGRGERSLIDLAVRSGAHPGRSGHPQRSGDNGSSGTSGDIRGIGPTGGIGSIGGIAGAEHPRGHRRPPTAARPTPAGPINAD